MDSEYSFSLTTFAPSGKLLQIEYALKAVDNGNTALGVKAKNGVVLATEKLLTTLHDDQSFSKVSHLFDNVGTVYAGMPADFRMLLRKGQKEAETYYKVYREPIPMKQMVSKTATIMQEFTQQGGVRPCGVSLLVAGYDDDGPSLHQVDPSGTSFAWKASAIGKNHVIANTFLEKRYNEDIELEDAIHTALLTLGECMDEAITYKNIEVGIISDKDKKFRVLSEQELKDYILEIA
uniref:Proteasome alpha-type subunits domain-containing protein n=1 Tax=Noctiluca scintillans TaxID=2966 RepID=A0A7S1AJK8_NOCSC